LAAEPPANFPRSPCHEHNPEIAVPFSFARGLTAGLVRQSIGQTFQMCRRYSPNSNSALESPDCRMMLWSVPVRSSRCRGTGTVVVPSVL
jgi:hypothetical protein